MRGQGEEDTTTTNSPVIPGRRIGRQMNVRQTLPEHVAPVIKGLPPLGSCRNASALGSCKCRVRSWRSRQSRRPTVSLRLINEVQLSKKDEHRLEINDHMVGLD